MCQKNGWLPLPRSLVVGKFTSFVYHSCQRNQSHSRGALPMCIRYREDSPAAMLEISAVKRYLWVRDLVYYFYRRLTRVRGKSYLRQHSRMIASIHKMPLWLVCLIFIWFLLLFNSISKQLKVLIEHFHCNIYLHRFKVIRLISASKNGMWFLLNMALNSVFTLAA